MKDEKYMVFKRNEFYELMGELALPVGDVDCAPVAQNIEKRAKEVSLQDAVVIRKQDMFAAPALHAYASSIQTVIELLESLAPDPNIKDHGIPGMPVGKMARLHEIRDYFFQQALEADDVRTKKVPD